MSPLVPNPTVAAAASKSYVDAAVARIGAGDYVRESGDVMTGALTFAGDPSSTNQAANRHYVISSTGTQRVLQYRVTC